MRTIILVFILFAVNLSFGQEIKEKKKFSVGKKEIYYQTKIKGVGIVKEGEYKCFFTSNDKPDVLIHKGQYKEDKKSGVWSYYNTEGDSICVYDFDNDSVIYNNPKANRIVSKYRKFFSKQSTNVYATCYIYSVDFKQILPEDIFLPLYIEGDKEFYDLLFASVLKAIEYYDSNSKEYPNFTASFKNIIKLKISKTGKLEDVQLQTFDSQLGKLKNLLLSKNLKWIPAYKNNKPIDFELQIPILCFSKDDEEGYNFEIIFCPEDFYGKQIPYCNKWPNDICSNSEIWGWIK
jgi:hypothetical protein